MSIISSPEAAAVLLKQDRVVAFPTETVYGLGASIASETALRQIFSVKQRPFFDPLIVHVADVEMARPLVADWPVAAQTLAENFWPGSLTLVLPKTERVSSLITSGLPTVALRVPQHPLALGLLRQVGPLAAPSANRFGRTSPSSAQHVQAEFHGDVPVLDGGLCAGGIESTVVQIVGRGVQILRPGLVTAEQMAAVLGPDYSVVHVRSSQASPGHMEHHYQPEVPMVLIEIKSPHVQAEDIAIHLRQMAKALDLTAAKWEELKLQNTPELVARTLYADLRDLSEGDASAIYVLKTPSQTEGLWSAVWDRLWKAATIRTQI